MEKQNILVLGGNGYLGSKVVRELVNAGNSVVCTRRANSDISRLKDINIKWIPASTDAVATAALYTPFDFVINMVCNYGKEDASNNVLYRKIFDTNVGFPLEILDKVIENGTRNFITIGTGLPDHLNAYSFSKKVFGEFGNFYVRQQGINFTNLQLEMFYGADEPRDRFISSIIYKMIAGEDVNTTLGTQRRDIIASEDVVKAIMLVIKASLRGYNEIPVGTGEADTISEIVDYIWEQTGKKSHVNKGALPMRQGEPNCIADIRQISQLGEWHPISWKQGIKHMITKIGGNHETTH